MMATPHPHAEVWDNRPPPVVLVHGSFAADPASTWGEQRVLAASYRLLVAHRRGYGRAAPRPDRDLAADVADVVALLGDGSHLVGYSDGSVVALLAAAHRPDLVRSLALIEPPAYGVAPDHPAVQRLVERVGALYPATRFTPEEFRASFLRALGAELKEPVCLNAEERQAVVAAMGETPPWEAPIDLEAVAAGPFPKLVVSGGWDVARDAVADVLERRLGAERAIIPGAGHAVQRTGEPFNRRLLAFWQAAERSTSEGAD